MVKNSSTAKTAVFLIFCSCYKFNSRFDSFFLSCLSLFSSLLVLNWLFENQLNFIYKFLMYSMSLPHEKSLTFFFLLVVFSIVPIKQSILSLTHLLYNATKTTSFRGHSENVHGRLKCDLDVVLTFGTWWVGRWK